MRGLTTYELTPEPCRWGSLTVTFLILPEPRSVTRVPWPAALSTDVSIGALLIVDNLYFYKNLCSSSTVLHLIKIFARHGDHPYQISDVRVQ